MQALRDHFSGEGKSIIRIAETNRMKRYLHYKGERALSFEFFLTNGQKMFNIYDKEGKPMLEDAKLRFLFDGTHHASLQVQVEALKSNITTGTPVTYTTAANHLTTAVSQLTDYGAKARIAGAVGTGTGNAGIINSDGNSINVDLCILNWNE